MSFVPVFRFMSFALFSVALASAVSLLIALGAGEPEAPFAASVFISTFLAGSCLALSKGVAVRAQARSGMRELVLALGFMGYFGIALDYSKVSIAAVAIGIAVDDTVHLM